MTATQAAFPGMEAAHQPTRGSSPRPVTLDDIEAALWHRFAGMTQADADAIRALVTAYAEAAGLYLARERVLTKRRAALEGIAEDATAAPPPAAPADAAERRSALMATVDGHVPAALRAAHAEASRLRLAGQAVPPRLGELDRAYERTKKRQQRARARAAAGAPEGEAA